MVPYGMLRSRKHLKLLLASFTKSPVKCGITTFFSHHLTRNLTTCYIKTLGNLFIASWFLLRFFTSEMSNMHLQLIDPMEKIYNFQIFRPPQSDHLGDRPSRLHFILRYNKKQKGLVSTNEDVLEEIKRFCNNIKKSQSQ